MGKFDDPGDSHWLDLIAAIMSGNEWSADTLDEIRDCVLASGREILDSAEYAED